ncbi:MAG: hypothetical protein QMC93_02985 [Patescibacteria group bacterium]|nr:hypothetical protein [Patescibacteria group bacterium]
MTKSIKSKEFILLIIILGIFIVFSNVLALEVTWPPSPRGTKLTDTSDLTVLVKYLYEWGIALGGLAVFIALIIAGFQYLTSMGEPTRLAESKDRIKSAFFGLILLLSSWLILNTINPQLTTLQPIELKLEAVFTPCDTTEKDCPEGYQCDDPNPGDGKKEGICIPKIERISGKSCTSVKLYKEYDFGGGEIETVKDKECKDIPEPYSSLGFIDGDEDKTCGGSLQFFSKMKCKDLIISLPPTNRRISTDRPIKSVQFFSSF